MTAVYRTPSGILSPGRRLGRGGEGEVFALADGSPRALKIYAAPDAAREAKIRAMSGAGLASLCPGVAFPEEPAYAADGTFAGFVMPLVQHGQPIHELCSPGSRRLEFPTADWRFLIRTAVNMSRLLGRVHAAGAIVGDLNGSGVLVSKRAVVSLIDADSFQWGTDHLCRVGVPEYTPPELQGRSLTGVSRTVQHDAFGLAVLIFQLLFLGRHPHAGVPKGRDLPLIDAIGQNCFAYSRLQSVRLTPPGGTLLLTDLPLGLATLFERAFAGIGPRPLPSEWVVELLDLERTIVACDRKDGHYRAIASHDCPWCRMEQPGGLAAFGTGTTAPPRVGTSASIDPVCRKVRGVLARAGREGGEGLQPPAASQMPAPSAAATDLLVRFGPPGRESGKPFLSAHRKARRAMEGAVDAWRNRMGAWIVARSASKLAEALARYDELARNRDTTLTRVTEGLHARQIVEELGRLPVSAAVADVPGLGRRGVARLASAGIRCAADLSRPALEAVQGVGERGIVALLLWRDAARVSIGRSVDLRPAAIASAFDEAQAVSLAEKARLERTLNRLADELAAALDELAARAALPDGRLKAAGDTYRQALADLRHLGLPELEMSTRPARAVPTPAPKPRRAGGAACPVCGGSMVKRWARSGTTPGRFFLGCANYPTCTGSRPTRSRKP